MTANQPTTDTQAIRLGRRTAILIVIASIIGLMMFSWPLLLQADPAGAERALDAPMLFMLLGPFVIAVVLSSMADGGMDAKSLAMLGVLSAINAALRPLGAGTAGLETVFFMLVLAGRVFGPGFGFALGCTSIFASALLTAGVGPWLPFQMMASAWIGLLAGLLPRRVRGKREIVMLAVFGVIVAYVFGFLMNMTFWPFAAGVSTDASGGDISYVPGAPVLENLHKLFVFTLVTSLAWDTGRAITNAVAIVLLGPAILMTLRRAAFKASFGHEASFSTNSGQPHSDSDDRSPESA